MGNPLSCETDRDAPLTPLEKAIGGLALLSFLVSLLAISLLLGGCTSPDCGSKTIVGNHYALPKVSNDTSDTDIEVYESTEGAVVYTRKDSRVEIEYSNAYTNSVAYGLWGKVGNMALKVAIEPLDCGGGEGESEKP